MRSPLKRDGGALAIFVALTLVLTNPLVLHLASAVEDKQDALLNTWIIAWVGHALITDPLNLFQANIFYPYPNTLAFSETLLPQGLFALPFNLACDNTILGYNLVLLTSFFLAAYAMYLFVFDLTRARDAGVVAGIIFAFNPYNLGNLAQVQLLSFGWMPLALLWLRRLLRESTVGDWRLEIGDWRLVFLFALCFSLQALSSFYYAFLAGFAVALYIAWFLIAQYPIRKARHASRFTFHVSRFTVPLSHCPTVPLSHCPTVPLSHCPTVALFTRLALSAALIALFVVPFFLPYLQVQREMGFERKVTESEPFSASLKLYTEVSPQNVLYGNWLAPRPPAMLGGYPLDNLFPGFVALVLAIVGIAWTKNRERWFYFLLLTFAFLLSLGPRLYLAPNLSTDIALPYRWLYDAFPLLRALRAPVRFDALVMLALAVLAGFGVRKVEGGRQKAESSKQRAESSGQQAEGRGLPTAYCLLHTVLTALIALEYLAIPAAHITPVPVGGAIPEYVRWLRAQPRSVILELPMIASEGGDTPPLLDLTPQYLSTYHWHATPDGYSGFVPPRRGEIAYEMQFFPGERALSLLHALDVQYVILRDPRARADGLELAQQFGNDRVYRVAPRAQDESQLTARLFLPQPAAPSQNYFAYIIVANRGRHPFAVKPTDTLQVEARWNDDAAQRVSASLPLVTSSVSIVPVRLLAPPRVGSCRLDLRVSGMEIGDWRLSGDVLVQVGEPARQVVLPARVERRGGVSPPPKSSYAPGEVVEIALAWLPLNKIDAYYSASVRVVDARGDKVVAEDRQPATPTLLWTPGVRVLDVFTLTLPREVAPGEYTIQALMYQAEQGVDALLLDENFAPREATTLGQIVVE